MSAGIRDQGPWARPAVRGRIEFSTLDLSTPYRRVFEVTVPRATLVADSFHVCQLANTKLDECRRRVQNEALATAGKSHWDLLATVTLR